MSVNVLENASLQTKGVRLLRTLTLAQVIMMGLAYLQPLTIFDTFAIVSKTTSGHVPTSYIIALVAVLFTAVSYGRLVKRYPSAGSAYTYTQKSINPHIGFMVGWSSLVDYLLMPMINILLAKIYIVEMFPQYEHLGWIVVVLLTLIMTFVNLASIKSVANTNSTIVIVQVAVIAVFVGLAIYGVSEASGTEALVSSRPFYSEHTAILPLLTGATILCFSFLGFDGISSLSEETPNAERVIPKAIFLTALIGGVLFIIVAYFIQLYFPETFVFKDPEASLPEIALVLGGVTFQTVVLIMAAIFVLSSGMAAHAGVSRLLYVMGRDGVFPKRYFGSINRRTHTPVFNILLVGAFALTAIFVNLEMALSLISFGALIAFTFVNLSVISLYYIREKRNKTLKDHLNFLILPLLGVICILAMWTNLEPQAFKLGLIWALCGIIYMACLTRGFRRAMPQYDESKE